MFHLLTPADAELLSTLVPGRTNYMLRAPLGRPTDYMPSAGEVIVAHFRPPDLTITPDGRPYIYRWHIIPRRAAGANVYLHLQVADDPERPLHDHPWDNQSVILAGGHREVYEPLPALVSPGEYQRTHHPERLVLKGRTVHRRAEEAHRLFLAPGCPYTISLFSTGPVVREWGFWTEKGWVPHHELITETADGHSIFKERVL